MPAILLAATYSLLLLKKIRFQQKSIKRLLRLLIERYIRVYSRDCLPYVCLSACYNWRAAGRILIKFKIGKLTKYTSLIYVRF
jgi:hypothetical protein